MIPKTKISCNALSTNCKELVFKISILSTIPLKTCFCARGNFSRASSVFQRIFSCRKLSPKLEKPIECITIIFLFTFLWRGSPYKGEPHYAILIELQIGALPSAAAQKKITWCEALSSSSFFKVARRAKIKVSTKSVIFTTSNDI